jgi:hypothetical protein
MAAKLRQAVGTIEIAVFLKSIALAGVWNNPLLAGKTVKTGRNLFSGFGNVKRI